MPRLRAAPGPTGVPFTNGKAGRECSPAQRQIPHCLRPASLFYLSLFYLTLFYLTLFCLTLFCLTLFQSL